MEKHLWEYDNVPIQNNAQFMVGAEVTFQFFIQNIERYRLHQDPVIYWYWAVYEREENTNESDEKDEKDEKEEKTNNDGALYLAFATSYGIPLVKIHVKESEEAQVREFIKEKMKSHTL